MHRRHALRTMGTAAVMGWSSNHPITADQAPARTGMGILAFSQSIRQRRLLRVSPGHDLFAPLTFVRHCHDYGAGGVQVSLGRLDAEQAAELRRECASRQMFLEGIINPPKDDGDLDRFRAEMQSAGSAGARAMRCVIIPGRRYEQFHRLEDFRAAEAAGRQMVLRAAPIAEKLRLPLAVENHKDQRNDERLKLLEEVSSEYVGACLDTGNSLALLEDPLETIRAFAPWARSVHFKDQALQPYTDGFLLGDIPLGQGALDLPAIVRILREQQPELPFCLELLTREPLRVPCLTDDYFSTFPQLPARDLARTTRLVATHHAPQLQAVASLSDEDQLALEDANIRESLRYAREVLGL